MPATMEDYEKLNTRSQALADEASQFSSGATSLGAQVMDAVRADRATRGVSQMATDVGQTMGQIPTDTAGIRARTGDMVNPLQQDVLTAQQRGQNLNTLGTLATQQEYNQGTITDILGEQAASLQAIAQQKAAEAQKAAAEAQDVMNKLEFQRQQQMDAWNQYVQQEQLNQGWAQINKPSGGSGVADTSSYLAAILESGGNLTTDQLEEAMNQALASGDTKSASALQSAINTKLKLETAAQKNSEASNNVTTVMSSLDTLSKGPSGLFDAIKWNTQKNILTQVLAKLVENNRLSDADRAFYLGQMPSLIEILISKKAAKAKIEGVKAGLQSKLSGEGEWE